MGHYSIDESQSPLYKLDFYGHLTYDQTKRLFEEVDVLLARSGTFGVVMNYISDEGDGMEIEEDFDGDIDSLDDHDHDHDDDHDHNDGHKHRHEPGAAKMQKAWLVANRDRFQRDCVGIAMISNDSKWVKFYAPVANKIMTRMYRCPGAIFGDVESGMAWVQARMPEPA